jgi:membrane associated rhomboid family serine protease
MARPLFIPAQASVALGVWLAFGLHGEKGKPAGLESMLPKRTALAFGEGCVDNRHELWRWWTYQFTHTDIVHVCCNVVILLTGVPQERFHGSLRMALVFHVGVFGGACAVAVSDIHEKVVGMSAGNYAVVGLFFADLILNWANKKYRRQELVCFLMLILLGIVYNYALSHSTRRKSSHAAHIGGAIAGMLSGMATGRSVGVRSIWGQRRQRALRCASGLALIGLAAYSLHWGVQWPPRTIWDDQPWCWLRAVSSTQAFGDVEWRCVRCQDQACVEKWSQPNVVDQFEFVQDGFCQEHLGGFAVTER